MNRDEIDRLKDVVLCQAVLQRAGFAIDAKESSRGAVKHRRGGDIIIVTHGGKGWFDPLSDAKGDVFLLIMHLERCGFRQALSSIGSLASRDVDGSVGIVRHRMEAPPFDPPLSERWHERAFPRPGSASWHYLSRERCLPAFVIHAALAQGILREGPKASIWAAHLDDDGKVSGWESRGPQWRGFAKGGVKSLFRFGASSPDRICVTEAAIDALSLAALEGIRHSSLYVSTGGGWAPATTKALQRLSASADIDLVAATDANAQGDAYADRLRALAEDAGCSWFRLRPQFEDWNAVLKRRGRTAR